MCTMVEESVGRSQHEIFEPPTLAYSAMIAPWLVGQHSAAAVAAVLSNKTAVSHDQLATTSRPEPT